MIYKSVNNMLISSILCILAFCPLDVDATSEQFTCNVTYNNKSSDNYSINIPKSININEDMIGEYEVSVSGSIETYKEIYIKPVDSIDNTDDIDFYMVSDSDENARTIINQDKITWNYEDVSSATIANGTISSSELKAGEWEGTFYFEFGINEMTSSIENIEVPIGGTSSFNIYYNGEDVTNNVTYDIDNSNVSIKNGKITISSSATSDVVKANVVLPDKNLIKTITINIFDIEILKDNTSITSITLTQGDVITLKANIKPSSVDGIVSWNYNNVSANVNDNIITIDTTSMNSGTYNIVANYGGCSETINLIVEKKEVDDDTPSEDKTFEFTPDGVLAMLDSAFREVGFTYSLDYATEEELSIVGPTLGMGWGLRPISSSYTYEDALNDAKIEMNLGYRIYYLEYIETQSDGTIVIKIYNG